MTHRIVADGKERAAAANQLDQRQEEAALEVRERYRPRLASARGLRRVLEWIHMHKEIRQARKKLEDELASERALYFQRGPKARIL